MKKNFLLFTVAAGIGYLAFSSYQTGPAANLQNRTGAKGSSTTCGDGGCHGTATGQVTPAIRVDSVGNVPVSGYISGMTYTVTVTASNSSSLTHYGFQYAAVYGTGGSQAQAGTFGSIPTQVAQHSLSSLNFIEQTAAISGATLSKSFTWTAPAASVTTDTVTMYLTVNAVNGNGSEDNSDVSGNVSKKLKHYVPASSVASIAADFGAKVYPNPVADHLNLQLQNAGSYTISVFDMTGRNMASQIANITSLAQVTSINTSAFAPGMYVLSVEKDGSRQVVTFVK